jgi:lipopolysaccharide export system permease protein
MIKLDRLIAGRMLFAFFIVLAVFGTVDFVFAIVDELGDVGNNYSIAGALYYITLTFPSSVYELFPFAALGGALLGLGSLASSNELVVMRASGISVWRIVWSVAKPTFFLMMLGLILGEYIAPPLDKLGQDKRAELQGYLGDEREGFWQKAGNEFIYIDAVASDGRTLYSIIRYVLDEEGSFKAYITAKRADFSAETGDWTLIGIRETEFNSNAIRTVELPRSNWKSGLSPNLLQVLSQDPDTQSISGLFRFSQFLEREGLESNSYYLAFWKKILQPFMTLALVLLGVSSVFGPLREAATGYRVFVGLTAGLLFTIIQRILEPTSILFGLSPLFAALIPVFIASGLGLFMLNRTR